MRVQTTDRKTGVGEFEGKEVEGEREGGRKRDRNPMYPVNCKESASDGLTSSSKVEGKIEMGRMHFGGHSL